jgi:acetolactate synthase-1/2/3 large subunit
VTSNATVLAREFAGAGIKRAFGLPGGEVTALIEACRCAGIEFYLVGHEASAAFMAEVTGKLTGVPGVCIATLGPGAMNLSLGVANAFLDRAPVIALTAQVPSGKESHFPHQRLDLSSIYSNITKRSIVLDGANTGQKVALALSTAIEPRAGPVHLMLASDLATQSAKLDSLSEEQRRPDGSNARQSDDGLLNDLRVALESAKYPLLIAGVGCGREDVLALRQFVAQTRIPYLVTPKAKGWLVEDSPGFLGVVGGVAADSAVMRAVDQSDLLLGIGFDPVECDKDWYVGRPIVNLDRAPTAEGAYRPVEIIGAIGTLLSRLAVTRPLAWPDDLLRAIREEVMVRPARRTTRHSVSPRNVIELLRELMPPGSVLTTDVGSHKYVAAQYWLADEPDSFLVSNGLSAMGFGIPAAIASKLAFPERSVVAVVGDGGMLMMLHNLEFLRQYGVHVVVVVLVDETLSLIRIAQQRRGYPPYGVDFPAPDFSKIARSFHLVGTHTETIGDVEQAVRAALRSRIASVIEVPVDVDEYTGIV